MAFGFCGFNTVFVLFGCCLLLLFVVVIVEFILIDKKLASMAANCLNVFEIHSKFQPCLQNSSKTLYQYFDATFRHEIFTIFYATRFSRCLC